MKEIKLKIASINGNLEDYVLFDNTVFEGNYIDDDFVLASDYYYNALIVYLMTIEKINNKLIERIERLQSFIRLYMKTDYLSETPININEYTPFNNIKNKEEIIYKESESINGLLLNNENNGNYIEHCFPEIIEILEKNKLKKNCFCYCKYNDKSYIAISGLSNDYDIKQINYFKWDKNKTIDDLLNKINNAFFNGEAKICHGKPNVPSKYINSKNEFYLYNFFSSPFLEEYCRMNFSCCERKIISYIKNYDNKKATFYCKYLCCKNCFPFIYKGKYLFLYGEKLTHLQNYFKNTFLLKITECNNLKELSAIEINK